MHTPNEYVSFFFSLNTQIHAYSALITSFLLKLLKVMSNQEAVSAIKDVKDARSAAKVLTEEAKIRKSSDDISCVVVKFQ